MIISVFDRVENIVGKGEIACTSNFSFSHNVFKRLVSQKRQKVSLCGNGLIPVLPFILLQGTSSLIERFVSICLTHALTLSRTSPGFKVSVVQVF